MCDTIDIINNQFTNFLNLPEKEKERLEQSQILKDIEKENMRRRAKQLDDQYLLDKFMLVDPNDIVFDDGVLMNITKNNRTVQNDKSYDYYNPKLTQGQSINISQRVISERF